jgi:hypothetical protein
MNKYCFNITSSFRKFNLKKKKILLAGFVGYANHGIRMSHVRVHCKGSLRHKTITLILD